MRLPWETHGKNVWGRLHSLGRRARRRLLPVARKQKTQRKRRCYMA